MKNIKKVKKEGNKNKEKNIEGNNSKKENEPSLLSINTYQYEENINNIDITSFGKNITHKSKKDENIDSNIKNKINESLQKNIPQNNNTDQNISNIKESKKEIFNLLNEQINSLTTQELYSIIKKEHIKNEKKFSELREEVVTLKNSIGKIQTRYLVKNFLQIFKSDLIHEEKEEIKKDNIKRGEITLERFSKKYSRFVTNENFKIVAEIIKKSGEALNKGNSLPHTLNLEEYENEIETIKAKYNINMFDNETLEKILFLKEIRVSDNSFNSCFDFIA